MITVTIDNVDHVLEPMAVNRRWHTARVASDARGGYILAEVMAVHAHECVERRWGRRNHDKPCNCGAAELAARLL